MMIALRSLLLALLGSYVIASSTERKLRSVPVAATSIQAPPDHLIGHHSGRRTQSCDALLATVQSCVQAFPGCGLCIDNVWDTLPETTTCSIFQDSFCDAIYEDCNCGTCTDELEDWFECLALTSGCDAFGFDCGASPPPPPPPTCVCASGDNGGAGGICLRLIDSSECPADPNLSARCTASEVAVGELCEADSNENGTIDANNCGTYDVYERIPCDGLPSEECTLSDFQTMCSNMGQNLEPACVVTM